MATACLGSSTAHSGAKSATASSGSAQIGYAVLEVHGAYLSKRGANPLFGGKFHQERFTLGCQSESTYRKLQGPVSWKEGLCLAILDYQAASRFARQVVCTIPQPFVDVRGRIGARHVAERITACIATGAPRALRDARVIVKLHPPLVIKRT